MRDYIWSLDGLSQSTFFKSVSRFVSASVNNKDDKGASAPHEINNQLRR